MKQKNTFSLYNIADKFGSIARKVNESSRSRKKHSVEALKLVYLLYELGKNLQSELEKVSVGNDEQRSQNSKVLSICENLVLNVKIQQNLLTRLDRTKTVDDAIINQLSKYCKQLKDSINEALKNLKEIIKKDNEIVLMDNYISTMKKSQLASINTLRKFTETSLRDVENAINGSSSNLERGLEMVKKLKNVPKLIKTGNRYELNNILVDANRGWNIAVEVNKSSTKQLEFAENVKRYTNELHKDSTKIKSMVTKKHKCYESNLQVITVLTVILSLKFKKYMKIKEAYEKIKTNNKNRDLLNDLYIYIEMACNDIEKLNKLNYDMTNSSHVNNELEDKTVKSTKKEIEYYSLLKKEVEKMTRATAYPIKGSNENITNGQYIENQLKDILTKVGK